MRLARWAMRGLSPRARGNRVTVEGDGDLSGSIPACAGESACAPPRLRPSRVYPRVRGGIIVVAPGDKNRPGLSPRARGNRHPARASCILYGSIPACAGESAQAHSKALSRGVYPRVRGGISGYRLKRSRTVGLSPRARGNPVQEAYSDLAAGSIPACAGESAPRQGLVYSVRVYPRVRGGIGTSAFQSIVEGGLSPRARGNLSTTAVTCPLVRSIPACAGESAS